MAEVSKLAGPDGGDKGRRLAAHWIAQINTIKDNVDYKRWLKRGEEIERRYRDERKAEEGGGRLRYSALWANVEILKPALYGKTPLPVAERMFKDKDPIGRNAATMLERGLRNEIEINGFTEAISQAVSDYLLPGRGTVWVRYEPTISQSVSLPPETQTDVKGPGGTDNDGTDITAYKELPTGRKKAIINAGDEQQSLEGEEGRQEDSDTDMVDGVDQSEQKLADTGDRISRESIPVDYVSWKDFFVFPARARVWKEVTAVGKRCYLSRDQLRKRFGRKIGNAIPLGKDNRTDNSQVTQAQTGNQDKAEVIEIWSRDDETVYWVCEGYQYLLDCQEDPLRLEYFYPCPRPIFANATNTTLVPVPDYIQYQDQASQVDTLTQRIGLLTKALRMAGVYNAASKDIQRLLSESGENKLYPVDDWGVFGESGGVKDQILWMPMVEISQVLDKLIAVKQMLIEEMSQLTGINDIMRGTSDARETLGGVRLKSNNTGTRLTSRQNEVARFARDTVRIMADIMCRHFSPQSLIEVSGALYEEGLGPDDMPPLSSIQEPSPPALPVGAGAPGAPPSGPMVGAPGMPPGGPGAPPMLAPPGGLPQPPMGQNVVPFRPPGLPMGGPPPAGMPPGGPTALTGQVLPPQPPIPSEIQEKLKAVQRIAKAIMLLRDEKLRGFRVDIEVDSTIYADAGQDQQKRTQFIAAITGFLEKSFMLGAQMPEAIPLLGKLMQFGVRGFPVGRDLETSIEEFTDQAPAMVKKMQAAAAAKPNPDQIKADIEKGKAETQKTVAMMKATSQERQDAAELQRQQIENEGEMANSQADSQQSAMDVQISEMQVQMEQMRVVMEGMRLQMEREKAAAQSRQSDREAEMAEEQHEYDMKEAKVDLKRASAQAAKAAKPAAR